jgi:hypothetical protein
VSSFDRNHNIAGSLLAPCKGLHELDPHLYVFLGLLMLDASNLEENGTIVNWLPLRLPFPPLRFPLRLSFAPLRLPFAPCADSSIPSSLRVAARDA